MTAAFYRPALHRPTSAALTCCYFHYHVFARQHAAGVSSRAILALQSGHSSRLQFLISETCASMAPPLLSTAVSTPQCGSLRCLVLKESVSHAIKLGCRARILIHIVAQPMVGAYSCGRPDRVSDRLLATGIVVDPSTGSPLVRLYMS